MFDICFNWYNGSIYTNKIEKFLYEVDDCIIPNLSSRVDISRYADKIAKHADTVFANLECLAEEIAACSVYCNNEIAFITSFAVKSKYRNKHIGSILMDEVIKHCREKQCMEIQLEVYNENKLARRFYIHKGFAEVKSLGESSILQLQICDCKDM